MTAQQTAPTTATGSRVPVEGSFANPSFDHGIRITLGATAYGATSCATWWTGSGPRC